MRAGVLDTSQSCQSPDVNGKWRLYAPVFASSTTTEPEYKFSPLRGAVAKSGAEFPAGTYSSPLSASNVNDVHVAPPVRAVPGYFPHLEVASGEAASGPRAGSPGPSGAR